MFEYDRRPLDVQVKIDCMLRCLPYPRGFYSHLSDIQVKAMYDDYLSKMARLTIEGYKTSIGAPHVEQLKLQLG
jgi:hypothetical protein